MELTISASPFELAGLRRAARDALSEVPPQVADDLLLALDEAATNAILHGSGGGDPIQWPSGFGTPGSRPPCLTTAQPRHPHPYRPPTGSVAAAGDCGSLAAWSTRSAWSVSRVARG